MSPGDTPTSQDGVPIDDVDPAPNRVTSRPSLRARITRPVDIVELVAGSPVGEYEIQAQIGEGGMGTVYSAVHPVIGKRVAIKVLKPELCANSVALSRFVQEAQAVNKIGHPNIVDVFAFNDLPDGRAYLVMEWLRGEDLKTRLARGPLPLEDACTILDGIARALDAAHSKDIVHRDLKPENVFLHQVENGPLMVKLLDFGIAKLLKGDSLGRTETGNMMGTPRYISPEQARGVDVDHRADIYSLGVMGYEILCGRPPFQGDTGMDVVIMHLHELPTPLSQFTSVPRPLEQCVMRMLDKDPAKRPSLAEVRGVMMDPTRRLTPLPRGMQSSTGLPIVGARTRPLWPILAGAGVGAFVLAFVTWRLVAGHGASVPEAAVAPVVVAPAATAPAVAPAVIAPTAPVQKVTLDVTITGATDAEVWVDSKRWGIGTAIRIDLAPGPYDVEVRPPGRPVIVQHVELNGPMSVPINVPVVAKPVPKVVTAPQPPQPQTRPLPKPHVTPPPTTTNADDELIVPGKKKH